MTQDDEDEDDDVKSTADRHRTNNTPIARRYYHGLEWPAHFPPPPSRQSSFTHLNMQTLIAQRNEIELFCGDSSHFDLYQFLHPELDSSDTHIVPNTPSERRIGIQHTTSTAARTDDTSLFPFVNAGSGLLPKLEEIESTVGEAGTYIGSSGTYPNIPSTSNILNPHNDSGSEMPQVALEVNNLNPTLKNPRNTSSHIVGFPDLINWEQTMIVPSSEDGEEEKGCQYGHARRLSKDTENTVSCRHPGVSTTSHMSGPEGVDPDPARVRLTRRHLAHQATKLAIEIRVLSYLRASLIKQHRRLLHAAASLHH